MKQSKSTNPSFSSCSPSPCFLLLVPPLNPRVNTMQAVIFNSRKLTRLLKASTHLSSKNLNPPALHHPWPAFTLVDGKHIFRASLITHRRAFSSSVSVAESNLSPTEGVKENYDKMMVSIKAQTCPPNAVLWSLIENCNQKDDIILLFDVLQHLRRFRLSNLRIHSNFNCNLCREIAKACVRAGALDFGKKGLCKNNLYGLSPSIGSAHQLLLHAKEQNDAKLMVEVMKLLKRNDLPLQPGTADIVFSICYNVEDWQLLSKYAKKFTKAGVKLRQTAFDIWMEFAAKMGDIESLWKAEMLRSEIMKKHTLQTGFSCAKGFLLEGKPLDASAIIQHLNQNLLESKKPGVVGELQKMVNEWPLQVVKNQKEEYRKALATALISDIPIMVNDLIRMDLEVNLCMEELAKQEGILY